MGRARCRRSPVENGFIDPSICQNSQGLCFSVICHVVDNIWVSLIIRSMARQDRPVFCNERHDKTALCLDKLTVPPSLKVVAITPCSTQRDTARQLMIQMTEHGVDRFGICTRDSRTCRQSNLPTNWQMYSCIVGRQPGAYRLHTRSARAFVRSCSPIF